MDLRDNNITIGELMKNPAARQIGVREFPQLMNRTALAIVRDMSLGQVLSMFGGGLSRERIERILKELKRA